MEYYDTAFKINEDGLKRCGSDANLVGQKDKIKSKRGSLTHEQLESHGCILSTVATDGLVLKHQAISMHSADQIFFVLDQLHIESYCIYSEQY